MLINNNWFIVITLQTFKKKTNYKTQTLSTTQKDITYVATLFETYLKQESPTAAYQVLHLFPKVR